MNSFFTWHIFLEVGKAQDLPSKIWQLVLVWWTHPFSLPLLFQMFGKVNSNAN
jgi:hypothetical protein